MTLIQQKKDATINFIDACSLKFLELLKAIGPGITSSTAYDTAWAARLYAVTPDLAQSALRWLRTHQLEDGSWGTGEIIYHHERVISTLIAMIALAENGNHEDIPLIRHGVEALDHHMAHLVNDLSGETIAFEMLFPTLMIQAKKLKILPRGKTKLFNMMHQSRASKISRSPGKMISKYVTMSFSAEMAGEDGLHLLDVQNLQETNGSIGYSPAATAYFLLNVDPHNRKAKKYLHRIFIDGGLPNVATIDIFERAWALWNLAITDIINEPLQQVIKPHLDYLERAWEPGQGAGTAIEWTLKDGDGTSMVYEVLQRYGRYADLAGLLHYETENYFRTFQLEANPSISTNIHALGALRHAKEPVNRSTIQKVLQFLQSQQTAQGFWIDKWHASPYYPTSHLIITCTNFEEDLVKNAVKWICNTQKSDGSWGYFVSTAEETAYCLQALSTLAAAGHSVPKAILEKGLNWLNAHAAPPYTPLWIGKCLYTPLLVVESSIISAQILTQKQLQ